MFSVLIPTWNNLEYLRTCIGALRAHSAYPHEILIHVNEGTDGTPEWLNAQGLAYSVSRENLGVCVSVNYLAGRAKHPWLLYLNDDMVCCPGWDRELLKATESAETRFAVFSSTQIVPRDFGNPTQVVANYGEDPQSFNEARMLSDYDSHLMEDITGHGSQPVLIHRDVWNMAGGYSLEFTPGMCSDDDLLLKLWVLGCRTFRMVGRSRVYHFGQVSTGRIEPNHGAEAFVLKWGITLRDCKRFLREQAYNTQSEGPRQSFRARWKRLKFATQRYPLSEAHLLGRKVLSLRDDGFKSSPEEPSPKQHRSDNDRATR